MLPLQNNMRVLVLGLGVSGLATVRYLHAQGLKVAVSETREMESFSPEEVQVLKECNARIETGGHRTVFCQQADLIIPSPGVPLDAPILAFAREQQIPIAGELAIAAGRIEKPVIAVTGSNGKTTVTRLIAALLEADGRKVFVGGNIGRPVLNYFLQPEEVDIVVLELSSFQLEIGGDFRPDIALLLNLSPDHLDRHGSMAVYVAAKQRIFAHQNREDTAIINSDDPLVMAEKVTRAGTVLRFGSKKGVDARIKGTIVHVRSIYEQAKEEQYDLADTALHSTVNRLNAAAAILAASASGCRQDAIIHGLHTFQPPEHRMSFVAEVNGVCFVNDSKATNIGALAAAVASCSGRVILIAGGRDKNSDFRTLRSVIRTYVRHLILIGEAADVLERALVHTVPIERVQTMQTAVEQAYAVAHSGDTVLLAPGCASFDMFSSYGERGLVFTDCVHNLQEREKGKSEERR